MKVIPVANLNHFSLFSMNILLYCSIIDSVMNNTDFYYRAFNRDNSSIPKFGVDNSSIQSRGRKFNIQLN